MSPTSRRRKPKKTKRSRTPHAVRSGADVMAKFGARHAAVLARMQAAHEQRGGPSFDQLRAQAMNDGDITMNEDGSETHKMSPEMMDLIKLHYEMFEFKFGRPMGSHDPIFFDWNADTPTYGEDDIDEIIAAVRAAAQETGVDPDLAVEHFLGKDEFMEYQRRRQ